MDKATLILGNINFYEESDDDDKRAEVNKITGIILCSSNEQAETIGDKIINDGIADSYLIPESYDGDIKYLYDLETQMELFKKTIMY